MERLDTEFWRAKEVARLLSLVEGERRYYQEILAILPAPVAILSSDLTVVSANRAFRRLFPTTAGFLADGPISDIVPLQGLHTHAEEVVISGIPYSGQLSTEGGRPLHYTLQPMRDWDLQSEPELLLLVWEAVAAPPLPAVQDPLFGLLDELPGIAWEMDPQTMRFTRIASAAVDKLGLAQSAWCAQCDFLSPRIQEPDLPALRAFYQLVLGGGPIRSCDYRSKGTQEETIWLRDLVQLIRSPEDQSPRVRGLTIDITESRRLNQFSAQAQKLDALSRLAGRVMHDCNNLIMIMGGYGEDLLHALTSDDPLRANVNEILAAGDRFAELASHLSPLTSFPALEPRPVAIDSLLTTLVSELRAQHPASLQLVQKLDAGNASVLADPSALADGLRALMQRAINAMHRGGTLTIESSLGHITTMVTRADSIPPAGPAVNILLTDTGVVISPDASRQLFEPSLEASQPARNLTAVFQTIQSSGGIISFAGHNGHGSQVHITLPAIAGSVAPSTEGEAPAGTEQETILLVEDELGIRNLIRKVLDRNGYHVLEAANGREALEQAQAHSGPIHLLLTDVVMPEINGVDLAAALRADRPVTKVLFISGYTGPTGLDVANLPPGSAFLPKPFAIATLVGKVRHLLLGSKAAEA